VAIKVKSATRLHEILPRYTQMPVMLITERLLIHPNRVFIIPAQRDLHVLNAEFRLKPISKPRGWPDVITVFLRSLTKHWDGKLIAVIVSGYDGDGEAALCGIKRSSLKKLCALRTRYVKQISWTTTNRTAGQVFGSAEPGKKTLENPLYSWPSWGVSQYCCNVLGS
jgi:hypothetical protein